MRMKYFAIAFILTATAVGTARGGLSCWACEDAEGRRAACDGNNEKEKECGDAVIGCVEEVTLNKETGESRTQRFCMEPGNPHNKSAIFSYFAPMVAERYGKLFSLMSCVMSYVSQIGI